MHSPESAEAITFAIAGQTSTGKTRLGEQIVGELREQSYKACILSVGDMFRLLTMHTAIQDDPEALSEAVQTTLSHTHIDLEPSGRVRLHYNGEPLKQTYHNGNNAAQLTNNGTIIYHVNEFIHTRLSGAGSKFDYVGLDGRERRGADVLLRTSAPDGVRVAIRRIEQAESCASLSDEAILQDIQARDVHEMPLVQALQLDDVNVLDIVRFSATPEADARIATRAAGILVDFRAGTIPANFGTKKIQG